MYTRLRMDKGSEERAKQPQDGLAGRLRARCYPRATRLGIQGSTLAALNSKIWVSLAFSLARPIADQG